MRRSPLARSGKRRARAGLILGITLGALILISLSGADHVAYSQGATPVPTPTPVGPRDGALDSLILIFHTPRSAYYALTYWSDGLRVAGFLGRPLTSSGPHPAIIANRGGFGEVGIQTGIEIVPYVEAGYVAVASQYRGNGGGEGREDFGGNDVHDVTNLIPLLQSLPYVDPNRIGMIGGSRGGMMTYLALKNETLSGQQRIQAAVTVGGISDLFQWDRDYGALYQFDSVLWRPLVGATPEENPALFQARSAVYWPDLINAPLLLLHGQADNSVSPQQSVTLATLLTQQGKTARLSLYPGGDHPLSNYDGGLREILDWFGQYLGGDGVDRSYESHEAEIRAVAAQMAARR
jgi:dipeptidyl aminopeptidase/acylaminoacyl peptidase